MRTFTKKELAACLGRNGAPAYIAYKGKVYDVSNSFLWRNGRHQVLHYAGVDLTDSLDQAPHGADLLKRFPVVGTLGEDCHRYSVETKLSTEEAIKKATAFFGEGGLGLEMTEQNPCCLYFEGGGGHVLVTASEGEKKKTTVVLETREWDYQVRQFMREIG